MLFIETACLHDLLLVQEIIHLAVCMIVRRLCTELTVLRASAASTIDDRAQIYIITNEIFTDLICTCPQLIQITCQKYRQIIVLCDSSSLYDFLCQFHHCCHFSRLLFSCIFTLYHSHLRNDASHHSACMRSPYSDSHSPHS